MSQFPVQDPRFAPPAPPRAPASSGMKTLLVVLGIVGGVFFLSCAGCCGLGYFVIVSTKQEEAAEVIAEVRDHPIVLEKLGNIEEYRPNLAAELSRDFKDRKYDNVIDVKGTKGSGRILVSELFGIPLSIVLRTDEGEWELKAPDEADSDAMPDMESDAGAP